MAKIRQCLGIDIGSHSIRVAELALKADSVEIKNLFEERLALDPTLSDVQRQAAIVGQLNDILKNNKIKTRNAVFCVPGQTVFVRQIKIPATTPERLHRIVHYEAREQIPFPLDQTTLEYQVFETENASELEVLLVAIRKDHIDAYMKLVRKTGLTVIAISVSSLALHNFHEVNACAKGLMDRIGGKKKSAKKKGAEGEEEADEDLGGIEEILAEVNLGAMTMDLAIPKSGERRLIGFTRTVPAAGMQMDRAIKQKLNLQTIEQANQIKEEQTAILSAEFELSGDVDAVNMAASQAATQVSNTIVAEIRRSLDFFISQPDGVAVDGVVISGGLSRMQFLCSYLEEKMGMHVMPASIKNEKLEISDELAESVPAFVIPIGLALQGIGLAQVTIDFLPQDVKDVRAFAENKYQLIAAIVMLLVILGLGSQAGVRSAQQQEALAQINDQLVQKNASDTKLMTEAEKANTTVQGKYAGLAKVVSKRFLPMDLYMGLLIARPPAVLFETLSIPNNGVIMVSGITPQLVAVNEFLERLKADTTNFKDAKVEQLSNEPNPNHPLFPETPVYEFSLSILSKSRESRTRVAKGAEAQESQANKGGLLGIPGMPSFKPNTSGRSF